MEPNELDLSIAPDGMGAVVVTAVGELDMYSAPRLRQSLVEAAGDGTAPVQVMLDLAGVTFVDSVALGVLVGALKRLRTAGGDLKLRAPTRQTYKVLELTGLTSAFEIEGRAEEP